MNLALFFIFHLTNSPDMCIFGKHLEERSTMTNQEYIDLAHKINEWTDKGDIKSLSLLSFELTTMLRDLTMNVEISQDQIESCKNQINRKTKSLMSLAKIV